MFRMHHLIQIQVKNGEPTNLIRLRGKTLAFNHTKRGSRFLTWFKTDELLLEEGNDTLSSMGAQRSSTILPKSNDSFDKYHIILSIVCVFLGTVLLMLILFLLRKYCFKNENTPDAITDTNRLRQNSVPPPYRAPTCACGSAVAAPGRIFQTRCEMGVQHYGHSQVFQDQAFWPERGMVESPLQLAELHCSNPPNVNINPVFTDDQDQTASDMDNPVDSGEEIRDLYKITDRSITQTVGGKLIVSVTHLVDHAGDILYLDNMGISLKVPAGAVKRGKQQIIFLVLNWDLTDNPEMKDDESLVSPVVYVGPHGVKLKKQCTLSFRHCSYNTRHIRVMRTETDLFVRKIWNVLYDQNDVTDSCYMTSDECQLKIDAFTLYVCVQAPIEDRIGKKWLQLAAFACPLRADNDHHQIRVYFLNKTPCALQWAIQNEATFGGKMICPEKVFLFDGNALDMFAKTRYISEQWELVDPGEVEKISFIKIWHGTCPHISICYRRHHDNDSQRNASINVAVEMNLHMFTYQSTREDDGEKLVIQVREDHVTPKTNQEPLCSRHHIGEIIIDINPERSMGTEVAKSQGHGNISHDEGHQRWQRDINTSNRSSECVSVGQGDLTDDLSERARDSSLKVVVRTNSASVARDNRFDVDPAEKGREIPNALRKQLKLLLDAKHMIGSDWRDFAEKLGMDKCIPILKQVESPTEIILDEAARQALTLGDLRGIFYDIDREDCAKEVEKHLGKTTDIKIPVENGNSSIICRQGSVTAYDTGEYVSRSYRSLQESSFDCSNLGNSLSGQSRDTRNWSFYPKNIPVDKINNNN